MITKNYYRIIYLIIYKICNFNYLPSIKSKGLSILIVLYDILNSQCSLTLLSNVFNSILALWLGIFKLKFHLILFL